MLAAPLEVAFPGALVDGFFTIVFSGFLSVESGFSEVAEVV